VAAAEPRKDDHYNLYLPVRVGVTEIGPQYSLGFAFQPPRERIIITFDVSYLERNDAAYGPTYVFRAGSIQRSWTAPMTGGGHEWGFSFGVLVPLGRD
jgi:hypothetical protein